MLPEFLGRPVIKSTSISEWVVVVVTLLDVGVLPLLVGIICSELSTMLPLSSC